MTMELSNDTLLSIFLGELDVEEQRENVVATVTGIAYIDQPISYERFFIEYLLPNKACILGSWATEGWRSRKEWVTDENKPNLLFMKEQFGESLCPVADCKQARYDSHVKTDMTFAEFVDYMEAYRNNSYPQNEDCLYLKDWHFQREFPAYKAYTVPDFFQSDWMNEFWDRRDDVKDDYRFVYIGPKGSWTPFHTDVFKSYSWSANICGRKKWIMFAPGEEEHMKDNLGQLVFDVDSGDLSDAEKYPSASKVIKRFEVYQEAGEIMFVPSGWYHQVYNMEDTISINHNWSNGCNIDLCWQYLTVSMTAVQKEISDCRDMEGWANQCQLILRANNGMDYTEFYRFLYTVAEHRIKKLEGHGSNHDQVHEPSEECRHNPTESNQFHLNHLVFDLIRIKRLIFHIKRNKEFLQLDLDQFAFRPKTLIKLIGNLIDEYISQIR